MAVYFLLTDRTASVLFCSRPTLSSWSPTYAFGLLQQSVLGPLYILFAAEIGFLLASRRVASILWLGGYIFCDEACDNT